MDGPCWEIRWDIGVKGALISPQLVYQAMKFNENLCKKNGASKMIFLTHAVLVNIHQGINYTHNLYLKGESTKVYLINYFSPHLFLF